MSVRHQHNISRFSLTLILLLLCARVQAQNLPDLSTTAPANTGTAATLPPQITTDPGGYFNYQRVFVPRVPITDAPSVNSSSTPGEVQIATQYKDGFNRTMQSVAHEFNPGKSLVSFSDNRFNQDAYAYLPYPVDGSGFHADAFQEQRDYYNELYPGEAGVSYSYTHNASNSAQRSIQAFQPGKSQAGQGRATTVTQASNAASEVKIWTVNSSGQPEAIGYYAPGQLFVEIARMPNESTSGIPLQPLSVTYKDKEGRIVLEKKADSSYTAGLTQEYTYTSTAYVYDDMGHLRYVLPPKAIALIGSSSTVTSTILDNLCFQYLFDVKGRALATRKPGEEGFTYVVYDRKDRVVMRQSPLETAAQQWEVSFYDLQGRVKATSIYGSSNNPATMQQAVDNWTGGSSTDLLYFISTDAGEKLYPGNSISNNTMMGYIWYDDYSITDPSGSEWGDNDNILQFSGSQLQSTAGSEERTRSLRTQGMVTGSKVRILPSPNADPNTLGDWTTSVIYYDEKGRAIYSHSRDMAGSSTLVHDHYTGTQYDFANRMLATKNITVNHIASGASQQQTEWNTNQYHSTTGRLLRTWHKVNDGGWAQLAAYSYDDLGRLKRKTLGNSGETQDFDYNIRGQLTGINGLYAETGNKQGLSRTFGESLKYDYGFTQPRYDGRISGMIWRGSGAVNAYGYSYDLAGRLKQAEYRQGTGTPVTWSKSTIDYTVSGLYYDKNGNILNMSQRGVKPGTGPVNMDVLQYSYEDGGTSNRLKAIADAGIASYGAGDFSDIANATDYDYDANGNLSLDGNKAISSVVYTRFNMPSVITFANGDVIQYSYDAAGSKVEELQDPASGPVKKTGYVGNTVFLDNKVQYVLTGEGRTMIDDQGVTPPKEEFFVKDHLGNVRSTIDVFNYPIRDYIATYEVASANTEGLIFDDVAEIAEERPGGTPGDNQAGMLDASTPGRNIGTSLLLQVMAGDRVAMNVNNFYEDYDRNADHPLNWEDMLGGVISTLSGGVGGSVGEAHDTKLVTDGFTSGNYEAFNDIVSVTANDPLKPKAYLNYILFDEHMNLVSEMTGAFQAGGNGTWEPIGTQVPLEIPRNGYLAVYLSNASTHMVYFDQLWVQVSKGKLLEETHYYPHGLPITGLGSKTGNSYKDNKHKYQGNEYNQELGLNWMDFHARQYDPQIGRFLGVDPLADAEGQQVWSSYAAMGNMPESCVDPNGLAVFAKFSSITERYQFSVTMDAMFGGGNWKFGENDEVIITNASAAAANFQRFMESGQGGGSMSTGETMAYIGNQILLKTSGSSANIQVGWGGNSLTISYEGPGIAETEVEDMMVFKPLETDGIMSDAVSQAGMIIIIGGGPEDVVADAGAGVRIAGAAIAVGIIWTYNNLRSAQESGYVYSKGGDRNIWPDQYGAPPTATNTDWNKSDSELADAKANEVGDNARGQGTAHNLAKKAYRNKRPKNN